MLAVAVSAATAEETQLHFLYFKNGKSLRCDAIWKGVDDYAWCRKSGNVQGFPVTDLDMKKTFELQAAINKLVNKSEASFNRGDWDAAIAAASGAIALDPRNEAAYTNRAGAYANKGKLKEALQDCNTAIGINPYFPLAYNNRAYALELSGQVPQAALDYEMSCNMGNDLGCKNYKRMRSLSN
ncbi:MAG: tetratricopeptide repeat protein [Deltaproteobacteria bacterium]